MSLPNVKPSSCDLYPSTRSKRRTTDELSYVLFCQKKQKNELLPHSSDSFLQHLKRVHYQTFIWRMALTAIQDVPQPESFGWVRDGRFLKPVYMAKAPANLELTTCKCKTGCQRNCSCNNKGLSCSEACHCLRSVDTGKNRHGIPLHLLAIRKTLILSEKT